MVHFLKVPVNTRLIQYFIALYVQICTKANQYVNHTKRMVKKYVQCQEAL